MDLGNDHGAAGTGGSAGAGATGVPSRPSGWGGRTATVGVWAALGAAVGYVLTFDPTDRAADPTGPCLWHLLTGVNGPSCGGTRMVWYLLHGDLAQAARHHLVALVAVPFVLYALVGWTTRAWTGRGWPVPRPPTRVYLGYAVVWVLHTTVLRNLPWAPFTWFDIPNLA